MLLNDAINHIIHIAYTALMLPTWKFAKEQISSDYLLSLGHSIQPPGPFQFIREYWRALIGRLPVDGRRPTGRPRQSWLRTINCYTLTFKQHGVEHKNAACCTKT